MEALIHNNKHSVVYGRKTIYFNQLYCDRKIPGWEKIKHKLDLSMV